MTKTINHRGHEVPLRNSFLRRQRQPKNRDLSRASDVQTTRLLGMRQVKRFTMFTAIDFGISSPGPLHIAANLFQDVCNVKPALEMAAAELPFLILLVASTLSRFLGFNLVVRELRRTLRPRTYGSGQKVHPRSSGKRREISCAASFYSKPFAGCQRALSQPEKSGATAALFARRLGLTAMRLAIAGSVCGRTSDRRSPASAA
jgi:hypothetical protein